MKTVIAPGVCFVIGTACGALIFNQKSRSDVDSEPGRAAQRSTLGSAIPGSSSGSGAGTTASAGGGSSSDSGSSRSTSGAHVSAADLLKLANRSHSASSMIELYRATEHLGSDALLSLAEEIEKLPQSDQRSWQLRNVVLARFAQVDPEAALTHAKSITNRNTRQQALSSVVGEIANSDLSLAATILRGIEDRSEFQQVANALAAASAEGAPELLLTLLKERKGVNLQWGYNNMFAQWARRDMQAAIANLDQVPSGQQRNYALQGIGNAVAGENLEAGLQTTYEWIRQNVADQTAENNTEEVSLA
jgi:hypothetical protein